MQGGCTQALKAALELARTGPAVFPCGRNKHPCTPNGFLDATKDAATVQELWRRHGGPLVGVRTGAISGVDVLDLDAKHSDAPNWWHPHPPVPPPARRRGGGVHLVSGQAQGLRCAPGKPAGGVEVRGEGGGGIWGPGAGLPVLDDAAPAPWPDWLRAQLKPPAPPPPPRRVI